MDNVQIASRHLLHAYEALGIECKGDMKKTPLRVAKAIAEMTQAREGTMPFKFTTFAADSDASGLGNQLIVVRGISFASMCAHHMMPFFGIVHVGYLPNAVIPGLSKVPRLAKWLALKPTSQEAYTQDVANSMYRLLKSPKAVIVMATASHTCCACRGVREHQAQMVTSAMRGREAPNVRDEFMQIVSNR